MGSVQVTRKVETEDLCIYCTGECDISAQLWRIEFGAPQGPASKPAGPGQTPQSFISKLGSSAKHSQDFSYAMFMETHYSAALQPPAMSGHVSQMEPFI